MTAPDPIAWLLEVTAGVSPPPAPPDCPPGWLPGAEPRFDVAHGVEGYERDDLRVAVFGRGLRHPWVIAAPFPGYPPSTYVPLPGLLFEQLADALARAELEFPRGQFQLQRGP